MSLLRQRRHAIPVLAVLLGPVCLPPAHARLDPWVVCDAAALDAADATGVPADLMRAIARVETGRAVGRDVRPWPWAVHAAGKGHWFDTSEQAVLFVEDEVAAGVLNVDIGCFQLNFRWHGSAFQSVDAMFDPKANALHAARFLQALSKELGGWSAAAAAYHSRTPDLGERYLTRVETTLAALALPDMVEATDRDTGAVRENRFPLLQSGMKGTSASLVPLLSGRGPMFNEGG